MSLQFFASSRACKLLSASLSSIIKNSPSLKHKQSHYDFIKLNFHNNLTTFLISNQLNFYCESVHHRVDLKNISKTDLNFEKNRQIRYTHDGLRF